MKVLRRPNSLSAEATILYNALSPCSDYCSALFVADEYLHVFLKSRSFEITHGVCLVREIWRSSVTGNNLQIQDAFPSFRQALEYTAKIMPTLIMEYFERNPHPFEDVNLIDINYL